MKERQRRRGYYSRETLATAPDVISSPEEEGSAERLEKLEIEKNSIDRSIERSVGRSVGHETLPIIVSFIVATRERICIHAEIRGSRARSPRLTQIFDFDRGLPSAV